MTTIRQIVTEAFRESNLIQVGDAPDGAEYQEAEAKLLSFIRSVFGAEFGENLSSVRIEDTDVWFTPNTRVLVDEKTVPEIILPDRPMDGERFAAIDVRNVLSPTKTLTVKTRTGLINGTTQVVLNSPGEDVEWFYRADLNQWLPVTPLTSDSQLPFPSEFDDFFILWLAFRLNPRFGVETRPESVQAYQRIRKLFMARYKQKTAQPSELGLLFTPGVRWQGYDRWLGVYPDGINLRHITF